jgi:hypothetical protein
MDYPAVAELTPELRQRVYDRLQDQIHVLTAEKIYQYFLERKRNYMEELQLAAVFAYDDHSFWERMEDEEDQNSEGGGESGQDGPKDPGGDKEEDPEGRDPEKNRPGDQNPGKDGPRSRKGGPDASDRNRNHDSSPPDRSGKDKKDRDPQDSNPPGRRQEKRLPRIKKADDLERDWQETSRRMEADLLSSGKEASDERGSLDRILSISNRRRTDYRGFLRKFAVLREVTTVDPDSFDYGFYNYGLEVYGNMPLIEENEYREMNRLRTLVIAIDTSASCQDVLVQKFLNETAAVLRNIGQFFRTSAVYIVECDEHVQNVIVIHEPADLENYASGFQVKGGFGTDFRPVFAWVDQQRRAGEIEDMEALMYFTDGMGVYPEKPTDYDTAFVFFNDEELDDSKVPDWAVRLYIDGEKVRM